MESNVRTQEYLDIIATVSSGVGGFAACRFLNADRRTLAFRTWPRGRPRSQVKADAEGGECLRFTSTPGNQIQDDSQNDANHNTRHNREIEAEPLPANGDISWKPPRKRDPISNPEQKTHRKHQNPHNHQDPAETGNLVHDNNLSEKSKLTEFSLQRQGIASQKEVLEQAAEKPAARQIQIFVRVGCSIESTAIFADVPAKQQT